MEIRTYTGVMVEWSRDVSGRDGEVGKRENGGVLIAFKAQSNYTSVIIENGVSNSNPTQKKAITAENGKKISLCWMDRECE